MYKPTLLIDLDGVLNQYGNEKYDENHIPDIKDGAKEFLEKLYALNKYKLILFTTRNTLLASKWLIKNGLDVYFENITNVKIPAFLHIDDRDLCFKGNFSQAFEEIINFKPYYK